MNPFCFFGHHYLIQDVRLEGSYHFGLELCCVNCNHVLSYYAFRQATVLPPLHLRLFDAVHRFYLSVFDGTEPKAEIAVIGELNKGMTWNPNSSYWSYPPLLW